VGVHTGTKNARTGKHINSKMLTDRLSRSQRDLGAYEKGSRHKINPDGGGKPKGVVWATRVAEMGTLLQRSGVS